MHLEERNLDFDTVNERRHTNSLKYDFAVECRAVKAGENPYGLLPLWVADMDFKTSSFIQNALIEVAQHGIFGYSEPKSNYFEAIQDFYRRRHNYNIEDNKWIVKIPGVMFGVSAAIKAFTNENEAVLIQEPVYMHFADVIRNNNRVVASNDLVYSEDGRYHIDFEDFEKKIINNNIKIFLLCSPHNPVCRVWTRDELQQLGGICLKHNVIIVSDEIHNDFVFEGTHTVFGSISEAFADNSVILTAPTKTFNLAGVQVANAIIKNQTLRRAFRKQVLASGYSEISIQGIVSAQAAYSKGEVWLDALLEYLKGNIELTNKFIRENLKGVRLVPMEATYLAWLDFNGTVLTSDEIQDRIRNRARLWLNNGILFGKTGKGFQRLNLACPRSILAEALHRLKTAFSP